jgi:hypothetical protein
MSLLNYTTKIPADKTITEIQRILATHGASAILTEYDDNGYITAISFKIRLREHEIGFRLPSDWRPVKQVLEKQRVERRYQTQEQALMVAWRIVKDWVEAQMAIVETKMVTMDQVFLPYAITREGKTLYEQVKDSPLLLGQPNQNEHE